MGYKVTVLDAPTDQTVDPKFKAMMEAHRDAIYGLTIMAAAVRNANAPTSAVIVVHRSSPAWKDADVAAKPYERLAPDVVALVRSAEDAAAQLIELEFVDGAASMIDCTKDGRLPIAVLTEHTQTMCYVEPVDAEADVAKAKARMTEAAKRVQ